MNSAPKPPPRYGDLGDIEKLLIAHLPAMMDEMTSAIGVRRSDFTLRQKSKLSKRVREYLEASRPYLLGLSALRGKANPAQSAYALYEGLVRVHLQFSGIRVPRDQDAVQLFLTMMHEQAYPAGYAIHRDKSYRTTSNVLKNFSSALLRSKYPAALGTTLAEWQQSKNARQCLQLYSQWPVLARQFRHARPKRFTTKAILQLAHEYKESCALFEQRLRLLVALASTSDGKAKSWDEWERESFNNLLQAAGARSELEPLARLADRRVRNALAHGRPLIDWQSLECTFHDRHSTVKWDCGHFFSETKRLASGTLALLRFEIIFKHAQLEASAHSFWTALQEQGK